jgi:hypothetical protein
MIFRLLADGTVVVHLAFVIFVVLGGLLVLRWRRMAWLHVPAAVWGAWIEFAGWFCPLTPLENWFRQQGGRTRYTGDFLEHYVLAIVYPTGLTADVQRALGLAVILLNAGVYAWILWRKRGRNRAAPVTPPEA